MIPANAILSKPCQAIDEIEPGRCGGLPRGGVGLLPGLAGW
jgi:hypothetical protein